MMSKLIWGAAGERFFEAGIDRGVLYVPNLAGVAWQGLKSISEAPTGGDPRPYYLDGFKYVNVSATEEFSATIEAFSSPIEFAVCDGTFQLAAGLFATQQPRKPFGLSYRTLIGDDVVGLESGYKIHLVYNALAAPAGRNNGTTSSSIDPLSLSWDISTRSPLAVGYKSTSHLIVQTKGLDPVKLAALEAVLYGDDVTPPSLPDQSAIIGLLT